MSDREYFLIDQIDFYKQQILQFEDYYEKSTEEEGEYIIPILREFKYKLSKYEEELESLQVCFD